MTKKTLSSSNNKPIKKEKRMNCLNDFTTDIPGYVYVKNKSGTYLFANEAFWQMAGLNSLSELIGKTDRELPWKERYKEHRKNDLYVIETGEIINCEEIIKTLDDNTKIFITVKKPLKDSKGKIVGVIGNSIDITENKKFAALQKEQEINDKTIKIMEMLAGNIAHELRTPLSIIKLNLDLLEHSYRSKKTSKAKKEIILAKTIELIKHVIQSNTYVLENILITLRNIIHGKIDHRNFTRTSIGENIEDTISHFPFHAKERKLVNWQKVQNFEYIGDDLLTRHVIFNLIKNALRAIKDAGKGKITITLQKGNDFNKLIFKDTALGISSDYIHKIFDQFESNEPSKTGSGLGLAFCKAIMHAYGGDITCTSQKDKFTEFVLSFPNVG